MATHLAYEGVAVSFNEGHAGFIDGKEVKA